MNILFIDNFDSFTYNLVDEFAKRKCEVMVYRNHTAMPVIEKVITAYRPQLVVLSPGPSHPRKAGICIELINRYFQQLPFLGVCLGHQCLIEAFQGKVSTCPEILHGKPSPVTHNGEGIFKDLANPFQAGRYHSLSVLKMAREFRITARTGEVIMGVQHKKYPLYGVQFHPESILTPLGGKIIANVLEVIK